MRITFEELRALPSSTISLLEILSLEGQKYMARIHGDFGMKVLSDDRANTRLFASAWQIQDLLGTFAIRQTQMVHASAYHEMVGMAPTHIEPMRIHIQRQSS